MTTTRLPRDLDRPGNWDEIVFLRSFSGELFLGYGGLARAAGPGGANLSFYAPDFFLQDPRPWIRPARALSLSAAGAAALSRSLTRGGPEGELSFSALDWKEPDPGGFSAAFRRVQRGIAGRELLKAVPVAFSLAAGKSPPAAGLRALLGRLLKLPRSLAVYGFWSRSGGQGLVGVTPELLFSVRGRRLAGMALAGTAPLSTPDAEFLADRKERYEHDLVVNGLVKDLSGLGRARRGPTRVLRLPGLKHLRTSLTAELNAPADTPERFGKLVRALHPTAALGVSPRELGLGWLRRLQPRSGRLRFGAPFAARCRGGSCDCVVAIRNVQWRGGTFLLGAGCGVTGASRLEKELAELRLKRGSVLALLDPAAKAAA